MYADQYGVGILFAQGDVPDNDVETYPRSWEGEQEEQDLYHIRLDSSSTETCCHQCNSGLDDDHDSRWLMERPGFHIARQGVCHRCNGKLRIRKLVNASIAWIYGRLGHMRREVSPEELQISQPARKAKNSGQFTCRKTRTPTILCLRQQHRGALGARKDGAFCRQWSVGGCKSPLDLRRLAASIHRTSVTVSTLQKQRKSKWKIHPC